VDTPETGTDAEWGAGALTDAEPRGEEAPASGSAEFPHPAHKASNVSEMPAVQILIAERGILLAVFMSRASVSVPRSQRECP
jgi:hypothetical protein